MNTDTTTLSSLIKKLEKVKSITISIYRYNHNKDLICEIGKTYNGKIPQKRQNHYAINENYETWLNEEVKVVNIKSSPDGYFEDYFIEFVNKTKDENPPMYNKINETLAPYYDENLNLIIIPALNKGLELNDYHFNDYSEITSKQEIYNTMITQTDAIVLYIQREPINTILKAKMGNELNGSYITNTEHSPSQNIIVNFDSGIIMPEYLTLASCTTRLLQKL